VICSSETSALTRTTRLHVQDDSIFRITVFKNAETHFNTSKVVSKPISVTDCEGL
jgi:hypothetical protein